MSRRTERAATEAANAASEAARTLAQRSHEARQERAETPAAPPPPPEPVKLPGSLDKTRFLDAWVKVEADGKVTIGVGDNVVAFTNTRNTGSLVVTKTTTGGITIITADHSAVANSGGGSVTVEPGSRQDLVEASIDSADDKFGEPVEIRLPFMSWTVRMLESVSEMMWM